MTNAQHLAQETRGMDGDEKQAYKFLSEMVDFRSPRSGYSETIRLFSNLAQRLARDPDGLVRIARQVAECDAPQRERRDLVYAIAYRVQQIMHAWVIDPDELVPPVVKKKRTKKAS